MDNPNGSPTGGQPGQGGTGGPPAATTPKPTEGGKVFDATAQTPPPNQAPPAPGSRAASESQTPPPDGGTPPSGGSTTPPPTTTSGGIDPKVFAETVAGAVRTALKPEDGSKKEVTREEFNKAFNVVDVTDEDIGELAKGGENAKARLNDFGQRVVRQAVTMAHALFMRELSQLQGTLRPYQQFADTMRESHFKARFFEKHPDLKDFEPILQEVTMKLQREGFKGDEEATFKKISDEARRIISAAKGTTQGTEDPSGKTQVNTPTMPTLSRGGTGGAGGAPASSAGGGASSTAKRIFG